MNATVASHDTPRPAWYMIAAIAALLWNLLGVAMFAMHYTLSPEALAALPRSSRCTRRSRGGRGSPTAWRCSPAHWAA